MRQKNTRIGKIKSDVKDVEIGKKTRRSNFKRILHVFYLFFPVGATFFGANFAEKIWIFLSKLGLCGGNFTQIFEFFVATFFFFASSGIVFILTRSEKSVIEIKISGFSGNRSDF